MARCISDLRIMLWCKQKVFNLLEWNSVSEMITSGWSKGLNVRNMFVKLGSKTQRCE